MNQKWIARLLSVVMLITSLGLNSMYTPLVQASEGSGDIEVMSYNILTSGKQDITATSPEGKTRGQMLIELLEDYQPDSIGLNEVTNKWIEYLENNDITHEYSGSTTYGIAGLKSDSGLDLMSGSSEYALILYRSDKYEVEREGGYWLSETPDKPSKYASILDNKGNVLYAGMTFNRVMSYAVLKDKATGNVSYIHINTHFDHQSSDYIDTLCAEQVTNKANELAALYHCPVIISGDFNANEGSNAYNHLAMGKYGYVNVKYRTEINSDKPTAPGYGNSYNPLSTSFIDHIFVPDNLGVYEHDIIENPYLSDHSCVYARISLNEMPVLYDLSIDGMTIDDFSPYAYRFDATTENDYITLNATVVSGSSIYIEISDTRASSVTGSAISVDVNLQNGDNLGRLVVNNEKGLSTVYYLNIFKSYGEPLPIISEIFPNAEIGYRYFEVTNVGTKEFNTEDYYFLWGNISSDKVSWNAKFIPRDSSQHKIVKPGETVVFWVTKGGSFADNNPTVADFNAKYGTSLTEDQVIISDLEKAFIRYKDDGSEDSSGFDMGSNNSRGMCIAKARDEFGNPYPWEGMPKDFGYTGPMVSVSSYYNVTPKISFVFANDAYKNIEAEWADNFTDGININGEVARAERQMHKNRVGMSPNITDGYNLLGNTVNQSTARFKGIDFGDGGASGLVFNMALRTGRCIGTAELYLANPDGSMGSMIGYCTVTAEDATDGGEGNYNTYKHFEGVVVDKEIKGVHDIIIKFITEVNYVGNIDYFYFTRTSLDGIKKAACEELENYKDPSLYRPEQQAELEAEIIKGKVAINAASSEEDVANALVAAKARLDLIKTDEELREEEPTDPGDEPDPGDEEEPTDPGDEPEPGDEEEPTDPGDEPDPGDEEEPTDPDDEPEPEDDDNKPSHPIVKPKSKNSSTDPVVTPEPIVNESETIDNSTGIKTSVKTITKKGDRGNTTSVYMTLLDGAGNNTIMAITVLEDGTTVETNIIKDMQGDITSAVSTVRIKSETLKDTLKVNVEIPYSEILEQVKDLQLKQNLEVRVAIPEAVLEEMKQDTNHLVFNIQLPNRGIDGDKVKISDIIIPANIIETAKQNGTNILAEITKEDGKILYSWTIDGKILAESDRDMVDINLYMNIEKGVSSVSDNVKANLKKDRSISLEQVILLDFKHKGLLPGSAEVKVYVEDQDGIMQGNQLFIYHFNEITGKLDSLPNSKVIVDQNGYITLNITHNSQYIILKEEAAEEIRDDLLDQITVTKNKTLYVGGTTGNTFTLVPEFPVTIKKVKEYSKNMDPAVEEAIIDYQVADKNIARISKTGKITAVNPGKTKITTTIILADGTEKKFTTTVTVKKASVSFTEIKDLLKVGEQATFKISVKGYRTKDIIWKTDKKRYYCSWRKCW